MQIHAVVTGETLQDIADKYGTTMREIIRLNELESEYGLVAGLHLLVPGDGKVDVVKKPEIEVNAYLIPTGSASDTQLLQDVTAVTYVSMFSYQVRPDGTLHAPKDRLALEGTKRHHISPLMTVTNFDGNRFNPDLAHTVMANATIRKTLIHTILHRMTVSGYSGVHVDFEHMKPADRKLYNQFIRELHSAVQARKGTLSIALGPKAADTPDAPWMGAFDYKTLGAEVDFVVLMTYEWGWVGGPPMAIAPLNQVNAVLKYATSVIPAYKILMGMTLYGYDWPIPYQKGELASEISNNSAQNLAITEQVPILFDEVSASPYFRYETGSEQHEVWFDDALSTEMKFRLVQQYGLRGVSYWLLGNSFPQTWYLLKDRFMVKH